jgi:DNA-binding NarL/FixJ family response regulator
MSPESKAGAPIRVFFVDDSPVVRRGLQLYLSLEPGLEICGEAEGEQEAFERILALQPDLAVIDLGLKEGNGFDLIKRLRQWNQGLKLLVFSMHGEAESITTAFAAGANGYVTKEEGTEKVLDAIHLLVKGKPYLSAQLAGKAPGALPRPRSGDSRRP